MKFLVKLDYKVLYLLWAVMFALTACLGFLFPNVTTPTERLPLQIATGVFFLPPWAIMTRAKVAGDNKHVKIVRNLALTSVALTCVLLCLNMVSAGMSAELGNALNIILTIVSAPLVCSNFYVMPLFLWGTLLMGALSTH